MTMCETHTHHGLVNVESGRFQTAELEAVHYIIICLLRIEVANAGVACGERCDAVSKTLLHEVVAKVHIVVRTYGCGYVKRTLPITLGKHLKHHKVILVESSLACQRDDHAVRYGVACHHHAATTNSILVNGDEYGIGRDDVHVSIL